MAASKVEIAPFEVTPLDAIPAVCSTARATFASHKTKNLKWRLVQLRKLYWALDDFKASLMAALQQDLRKGGYESDFTEVDWVKNDCLHMINNLETFAKTEKLKDLPVTYSMMNFRVKKEPLGTVLIIGPYNFPIQLVLAPLVGAIGAGCTAVIKPSELTPACAMAMKEMIESRLDRDAFAVVNGGVPETNALMEEKWDKIMFTGSAQVGSIIARKAAETLTPVCLELGGRNPAFVTKKANLALAARRLMWGKVLNAGQVCMSHNYVLVDKDVAETFIDFLKIAYKDMFPNGAKASPDLSRIVNARHFNRIKKMLDETKGKIVMGGEMDESELYIEPTAVLVDSLDDPMMQEESFGPIFSIYPVDTLDQALSIANNVHRTPLALMAFGDKSETNRILDEMTSGGACINDSYFHGAVHTVPFGGVGDSGWGAYRGKASFDNFTHFRTVSETPTWMDRFLRVRYMPYDWSELRLLQRWTNKKPNFDRQGTVAKGSEYWMWYFLGLGTKGGVKGALMKWLVVVAGYYLSAYMKARRA
ncbi:aldehyde dehydrogenase [Neurospora intermedia]|uniref:Aldehyde dehydrogenase n=1 Tax=Neurospora intermedia TaxID=5142 RepID=A0ABR3DB09_NEUIN